MYYLQPCVLIVSRHQRKTTLLVWCGLKCSILLQDERKSSQQVDMEEYNKGCYVLFDYI